MLSKILMVVDIIVCFILIVLVLMQESEDGANKAIMGGETVSFFDKNKGRTREGLLKKLTVIFGIIFVVVTIVFSLVYGG